MKLSDLVPYPSAKEQVRALKQIRTVHAVTRDEFNDMMIERIRANRELDRSAYIKMLKDEPLAIVDAFTGEPWTSDTTLAL